ncbi:hypothetical protein MFRU_003g03830 [Monilinia fructicola]|uniref:Uncharacterized protein n=1 Tax=Monilinia fructicola TaxID=38448 RepID=A0A5M9JVC8_MONFR|nr:hypothetical protein EYC84_003015 [Monilinia fructicola]KAG4034418.1 hypothetical protein MFRU_003g03830 [Monilinia fructicola]
MALDKIKESAIMRNISDPRIQAKKLPIKYKQAPVQHCSKYHETTQNRQKPRLGNFSCDAPASNRTTTFFKNTSPSV